MKLYLSLEDEGSNIVASQSIEISLDEPEEGWEGLNFLCANEEVFNTALRAINLIALLGITEDKEVTP